MNLPDKVGQIFGTGRFCRFRPAIRKLAANGRTAAKMVLCPGSRLKIIGLIVKPKSPSKASPWPFFGPGVNLRAALFL